MCDRVAVRRHRPAVEDRDERGAPEVGREVGDRRVHHRRDDHDERDACPSPGRAHGAKPLAVAGAHPGQPEDRKQRQQLQRLIRPEPQGHRDPGERGGPSRGPVSPAQQRRERGGADEHGQDVPEAVAGHGDHPERPGGPRHRHQRRTPAETADRDVGGDDPGDADRRGGAAKRQHRRPEHLEDGGDDVRVERFAAAVAVEEHRVVARDRQQALGAEAFGRLVRVETTGLGLERPEAHQDRGDGDQDGGRSLYCGRRPEAPYDARYAGDPAPVNSRLDRCSSVLVAAMLHASISRTSSSWSRKHGLQLDWVVVYLPQQRRQPERLLVDLRNDLLRACRCGQVIRLHPDPPSAGWGCHLE